MKKIALTFAVPALLLAAGCNNSGSMGNQSTNAPMQQPSPTMNTNSSSGPDTVNTVPTAVGTKPAGAETNKPAETNNMNAAPNASPP